MACMKQTLLAPVEAIRFFRASRLQAAAVEGRNIWLVGKKAQLCAAAKELADAVKQPILCQKAESMMFDGSGSTSEVPWSFGQELRKVTLVALPDGAGRYVTSIRPDVIAKQLHNKVAGHDVVLAVDEKDAVPAGLAVARGLSPCSPSEEVTSGLQRVSAGIRVAQGMIDMPPNIVQPTSFKDFALQAVAEIPEVTHYAIEGKELESKGYGLLWAVGKASRYPPVLLVLTHPGSGKGKGIALVGKGITFDTGGTALKSRDGMIGMKRDMGGAATVFAAFLSIARAGGLPSGQPLHCVICLADNAIGQDAFVQDDIITGYSGLTVEVNNTDAEGRLVLSDGVAHVAKHLDCETVVDAATLTGAQGVSTGSHFSTILASDEDLEGDLVKHGKATGDMVHPGIFAPELLLSEFDSEFADMKNSVKNRMNAQSSCAGLFIYKHLTHSGFTGKWLHIDMTYPVHVPLGDFATGWGVGLLCHWLGSLRSSFSPPARM
eukprot:TRINITY_DN16192_c0_g1_i1.p1 TRINITY_DN16192_c0_g1~~TRINITY_DN16192_c0_g1_i1.p1  ORF type:complete len:511 (+),score=98.69 TRINITY_DN16192_c0_g1_i1:61-1533(+)